MWRPQHEFHLTLKHWEIQGCVVSTVAADALVLKHQAISIHNVDLNIHCIGQVSYKKYYTCVEQHYKIKHFGKNDPVVQGLMSCCHAPDFFFCTVALCVVELWGARRRLLRRLSEFLFHLAVWMVGRWIFARNSHLVTRKISVGFDWFLNSFWRNHLLWWKTILKTESVVGLLKSCSSVSEWVISVFPQTTG